MPVADHRVDDAARVVAPEIVLAAVDRPASGRFVRPVLAVLRPVAEPRARDADAGAGAVELFLLVALVRREGRAAHFVRSVVAVGDPVALVRLVHALLAVRAFQLLGRARHRRTALFVFVVEAVVVSVANPRLRDAVAGARASELEVGASTLRAKVCNEIF